MGKEWREEEEEEEGERLCCRRCDVKEEGDGKVELRRRGEGFKLDSDATGDGGWEA